MLWIVQGEKINLKNGSPHSTIIQIVCRDEQDATQVLEDRYNVYIKLKKYQIDRDKLFKKRAP